MSYQSIYISSDCSIEDNIETDSWVNKFYSVYYFHFTKSNIVERSTSPHITKNGSSLFQ